MFLLESDTSADAPPRLPVALLGGFLGAGKTTLLNHLLRQANGRRLAVIVNDFGELNIDAGLIVEVEGPTLQLEGGCICCTVQGDLMETLKQLLEGQDALDGLLIEASGVSNPANIVWSLLSLPPELQARIRLDNVIAVVDALNATDARDAQHWQLFEAQIRSAWMIVLNKTQLAGPQRTAEARELIESMVPDLAIIETDTGEVPLSVLLDDIAPAFRPLPERRDLDHPFESLAFVSERPLRAKAFRQLMERQGTCVLRGKGWLHLVEHPQEPVLYHRAGLQESWLMASGSDRPPPRTELVLIGPRGEFDPQQMREALESCC